MDFFSFIFQPQIICAIVFLVSLTVVSRGVGTFRTSNQQLMNLMEKLDRRTKDATRDSPDRQKRIKELEKIVPPMREKFTEINRYYDKLRAMEVKAEEAETASEKQITTTVPGAKNT